jgi:hypothetical protein
LKSKKRGWLTPFALFYFKRYFRLVLLHLSLDRPLSIICQYRLAHPVRVPKNAHPIVVKCLKCGEEYAGFTKRKDRPEGTLIPLKQCFSCEIELFCPGKLV